jgi:hypothetical protein
MGDLLKNLQLNEDQIVKVKNIEENLNFLNNYFNLEKINIYDKQIISYNNYWDGFKSLDTEDSDRINFIFKNIKLLNLNRKYINTLINQDKKSIIKIDDFFIYDVQEYVGSDGILNDLTENVEFKKDFNDILDYLIDVSIEYKKIIEEKGENTSEGGNKKTKKSDKYTVKQLKTMAFVYNVNTTKKSNGKIVNLKSDELLTKLKKSKILL